MKKKSRVTGWVWPGHKKKEDERGQPCTLENHSMHIRRPFWAASPSGDGLPGSEPQSAALWQDSSSPGPADNKKQSLKHSRWQTDSTRSLGSLPVPTAWDSNYEKGRKAGETNYSCFIFLAFELKASNSSIGLRSNIHLQVRAGNSEYIATCIGRTLHTVITSSSKSTGLLHP